MKVLIFFPRLDATFKKGPIPTIRGSWPPIRDHWANFVKHLVKTHEMQGDDVTVLELGLWQFNPEMLERPELRDFERVYIPHKENHNFPVPENMEPRYYMQTVFPWLFTIDKEGWGAGMSISPLNIKDANSESVVADILYKRTEDNISKFDQPKRRDVPWDDYIFFACQIPHDETIKYHSKVGVAEALTATCVWSQGAGHKLIVKGHPINPSSMFECMEICSHFEHVEYVTEYSIHDLLHHCRAFFCVNSGVGFEAIVHMKPVFIFGRAEYDGVVNVVENLDINKIWLHQQCDEKRYRAMLDKYINVCYDTTNRESFDKVI